MTAPTVRTLAAVDSGARWLRPSGPSRAARGIDGALIVVVALVGLGGQVAARTRPGVEAAPITAVFAVLAIAVGGVLWWRRTRPLAAIGAVVAIAIVGGAVHDPGLYTVQLALAIAILVYGAASWSAHRRAVAVVVAGLALLFTITAIRGGVVVGAAFALVLFGLPFAAGYAARVRRSYLEEVERRLHEAERDRDEQARRAVADERNRIARELHDVVAHHVSLIGVQAGAARTALDRSGDRAPDRTRAALAAIETSSRTAVGEMRRLLDVLAPRPDDAAARVPQPGLADLDALVERVEAAGYDVGLIVAGDCARVPELVGLAAYRIAEEALTNVTRHSRARVARVDVTIDAHALVVCVRDPGPARCDGAVRGDRRDAGSARDLGPMHGDGPVRGDSRDAGSGRGLVGMRERAALFGGHVVAGPAPEGGFAVVASLPLAAR